MIFAKINPVLSIVTQDSLFNPTTNFITGSYMTAIANQYVLGANSVDFRVSFGNCEFDNDNVISFRPIHQENINLSGEDLESWGTDDSVVLDIIASMKGIAVEEIVSGNADNFGF
jgi:hypothetical protein